MEFIVKYFPEITIKSRPVRRQFSSQLAANVRAVLGPLDPGLGVWKDWDRLVVRGTGEDAALRRQLADALGRIPGIAWYIDVLQYPLGSMDDIAARTLAVYRDRLAGRTFAVRCKRSGRHSFRSVDVEQHVGRTLQRHTAAAGVDLAAPQVVVRLEIRDQSLLVVNRRHEGLGGYPLGTQGAVLSLVSGGFDSTVASYLTMKRGLLTHFCFFNLGGRDHEVGVKEVALYLWLKYGSSHPVQFITVPFDGVLGELLDKVGDAQMGVVLKRMMLRAATRLARQLRAPALVTGEAVAQVSSQTLANLAVIDAATDHLVLRPLIATDKQDIIRQAEAIGTAKFAAEMPEYCGVVSVRPTTRARPERVAAAEARFDMAVLDRALAAARVQPIDQIAAQELEREDVEVLPVPLAGGVVVDIRHPEEAELAPLWVPAGVAEVRHIPFYELHNRMGELDRARPCLLYCDRGAMSRLHAGHLLASGYDNVKVYRPGG